MKKIILYGAYGAGNLGDDLILRGALTKYQKGPKIKVICYGKPQIRDFNFEIVDVFEFRKNTEEHLKDAALLIFAGGGLFWAVSHIQEMLKIAEKARDMNVPVEIERLGSQGFHSDKVSVKSFLDIPSKISFRDKNSVDLLTRHKIIEEGRAKVEKDFATLNNFENIGISDKVETNEDVVNVGINHGATLLHGDEVYRRIFFRILNEVIRLVGPKYRFFHIPHTRHYKVLSQNDVIFGEYFWLFTGGRVNSLPFPDSVEDLISYYKGMDCTLSWRFHMLVTSTFLNIPAACFCQDGEHKYRAFSVENKLPIINMKKSEKEIILSMVRFIKLNNKKARINNLSLQS